MIELVGFCLVAMAIGIAAIFAGRCPKCGGRRQAGRWNEDDGIHIQCGDCGQVSVIPWEDLH